MLPHSIGAEPPGSPRCIQNTSSGPRTQPHRTIAIAPGSADSSAILAPQSRLYLTLFAADLPILPPLSRWKCECLVRTYHCRAGPSNLYQMWGILGSELLVPRQRTCPT